MTPTQSDVHVNVPLGNLSIGFQNEDTSFIADQVFPPVQSQAKSGKFFKYSRADYLRAVAGIRGPGQEAPGGGYKTTTADYNTEVQSVRKDIDDAIRANTDSPLDADADGVRWVTEQLRLKRDIDWCEAYFKAGVWATDADVTNAAYGNGKWSAGGSTPIKDLRARKLAMKREAIKTPNTLVLGAEVWAVLEDHPDFLDRISFGTPGAPSMVTPNLLAQVLGIQRVLIADAVQATSNEGATDSFSFIVGKGALLCYSAPQASIWQPSAGYTFVWTGYFGASALGTRMLKMRDDPRHIDIIEGEMGYGMQVVCPELGCFFPNVVA